MLTAQYAVLGVLVSGRVSLRHGSIACRGLSIVHRKVLSSAKMIPVLDLATTFRPLTDERRGFMPWELRS